jgi:hypothetical protein
MDLKTHLCKTDPLKEKTIQKFFDSPKIEVSRSQAVQLIHNQSIKDFDAFLEYLSLIGPSSFPVLSYVYDQTQVSGHKDKITSTLRQVGKNNLSELVKIASDEQPELTLEIISILGDSKDRRAINRLASFLSFQNKRVLQSAVKTLGAFRDFSANKILFSLLSHKDPEIRILASKNLHINEKDSVFDKITQMVKDKAFKKQSREHKKNLLLALARSKNPKAYQLLEQLIKKAGFFSRHAKVECAICAVEALKKIDEPAGCEVIKKMTRSRNIKIRKQCRKIMKNRPSGSHQGNTHDKQ